MREGGKAVCVYTGGGKEGEAGRSGSSTGRSHSSCVSFSCSGRGGPPSDSVAGWPVPALLCVWICGCAKAGRWRARSSSRSRSLVSEGSLTCALLSELRAPARIDGCAPEHPGLAPSSLLPALRSRSAGEGHEDEGVAAAGCQGEDGAGCTLIVHSSHPVHHSSHSPHSRPSLGSPRLVAPAPHPARPSSSQLLAERDLAGATGVRSTAKKKNLASGAERSCRENRSHPRGEHLLFSSPKPPTLAPPGGDYTVSRFGTPTRPGPRPWGAWPGCGCGAQRWAS